MGSIHFTLRTDKINSEGLSPIQLVYQIAGQRKYYTTKEKLRNANWNDKDQKAIFVDKKSSKELLPGVRLNDIPTKKEIDAYNSNLQKIVRQVRDIEKRFELDEIPYSSAMVIDSVKAKDRQLTKREDKNDGLFDFIDKYIQDNSKSREPGSLIVYRSLKNHLQAFQQEARKRITFDKIDYAFFQSFQNFLIGRNKIVNGRSYPMLNNTTIAKQLSTLKTFLNYAKRYGITVSDKYKDFKITKPKLEVIALTNDEFEKLFNHDLSDNKKLDQVRDIFCFACATGFRYSDLEQLRREHVKGDEIKINIKKTKVELTVPLNPYSMAILAKYQDRHFPLPIISNQKLNEYIKELCKTVGIVDPVEIVRTYGSKREAKVYPKYELISVHTGRKTFVTLSLEKGMTAEEVMKISGHENYESFKRYVNITEQRKKASMHKAWGVPIISPSNLKAV